MEIAAGSAAGAIQNISISAFQSIAGLKKEEQLAELYISQLEEELGAMTE